ncbi:hypothetical protein [Pedobacter nutrimenti]|uniref:hypothetical protein n=1 Tax=Pedobacter nutrimenti TaxID=1241337 RepID=UPI00292FA3B5|nr:hypothetical protein [Pedobacter nutrimenti]
MKELKLIFLLLINVAAFGQNMRPNQAIFTAPPTKIPSNCSTDAPLLGNGDLLAAMGGSAERLQFYLGKADLWELKPNGGPCALGRLDINLEGMQGASYLVTQDLKQAITHGEFHKNGLTLKVETAVAATENLMWVKLETTGGEIHGDARLAAISTTVVADPQLIERHYEKGRNGVLRSTGAACALRVFGGDAAGFTIAPGKPVVLVITASGLANIADYQADAVHRTLQTSMASLNLLKKAHNAWWAHFWSRSFVEIPDKALEQRYYLSHYCMASVSRLSHFPPGLFGWTLSEQTPQWGGAYFNNYNFFAPFYGLYAANHIEQAMPCNDAVIDAIELGRDCARNEGKYETMCSNSELLQMKDGVLFPVSILPYGVAGAPTTWGQRSNASYACLPLASTWYAT